MTGKRRTRDCAMISRTRETGSSTDTTLIAFDMACSTVQPLSGWPWVICGHADVAIGNHSNDQAFIGDYRHCPAIPFPHELRRAIEGVRRRARPHLVTHD